MLVIYNLITPYQAIHFLNIGTGLNDRGQIGVGDKSNRSTPTEIQFNQDGNGGGISSSDTHTLAW